MDFRMDTKNTMHEPRNYFSILQAIKACKNLLERDQAGHWD
jgi:hypothetical protein